MFVFDGRIPRAGHWLVLTNAACCRCGLSDWPMALLAVLQGVVLGCLTFAGHCARWAVVFMGGERRQRMLHPFECTHE